MRPEMAWRMGRFGAESGNGWSFPTGTVAQPLLDATRNLLEESHIGNSVGAAGGALSSFISAAHSASSLLTEFTRVLTG